MILTICVVFVAMLPVYAINSDNNTVNMQQIQNNSQNVFQNINIWFTEFMYNPFYINNLIQNKDFQDQISSLLQNKDVRNQIHNIMQNNEFQNLLNNLNQNIEVQNELNTLLQNKAIKNEINMIYNNT